MKTKFIIQLAAGLLFATFSYAQNDSLRTRNDKPGTPQSLRTPNQAPQSHVTLVNTTANQNVSPATSESNTNNNSAKTVITTPATNGNAVPKTAITLRTNPLSADSINKNPSNKVSNTSNPIRH